jgi:hypothetical protein
MDVAPIITTFDNNILSVCMHLVLGLVYATYPYAQFIPLSSEKTLFYSSPSYRAQLETFSLLLLRDLDNNLLGRNTFPQDVYSVLDSL